MSWKNRGAIYRIVLILSSIAAGPLIYQLVRPQAFVLSKIVYFIFFELIFTPHIIGFKSGPSELSTKFFEPSDLLDLGVIILVSSVVGFLLNKVFNRFRVNNLVSILLMIIIVFLTLSFFPKIIASKLPEHYNPYEEEKVNLDVLRANNIELIAIGIKHYQGYFGYYPKDLAAAFNCSFSKNNSEYWKNESLYTKLKIDHNFLCEAKDPITKKPYEYMSLDCSENKCKDYRIIANFDHEDDTRLKQSQKECSFGSGKQYVICPNSKVLQGF